MWEPTPREMQAAQVAVLSDELPDKIDAIFVHGAPIRSDKLDYDLLDHADTVASQFSYDPFIVLNGIEAAECEERRLAYPGVEVWGRVLKDDIAFPEDQILVLPPSFNTALESRNLLALAKERGWTNITISSHPHHILRCMLQMVQEMENVDQWPNVYCVPGPPINWNMPLSKPVAAGPEVEHKWSPHAKLGQLFDYLARRGA